jgi:hypothetical protein
MGDCAVQAKHNAATTIKAMEKPDGERRIFQKQLHYTAGWSALGHFI